MSRDPLTDDSAPGSILRTLSRPWPMMGTALACVILGLILMQTALVPLRVILLGAGLLLAGKAVGRRLQTAGWDLPDRVESAGLLGAAFLAVLLALQGVDEEWYSATFFLYGLMIASLGAAFLVLLSSRGRRIAVVGLVLFHFCGIFTAVSSVPPRNEPPPYLSMIAWLNFYRHYLFFTYFTNAYHFYSPDPGPATLVWFHIEYADGKTQWKKIPNRQESPIGLHHQRMLAAAESTSNNVAGGPLLKRMLIEQWEEKFKPRKYELFPGIPHASGEEIMKRRQQAADSYKFVDPQDGRLAPLMFVYDAAPMSNQYSEPNDFSRRLIASFARHIAYEFTQPSNPVRAVRVYRVIHKMMSPRELSEGKDPTDQTSFVPFYMGKYDPEGKLLDPDEPFLFWHLPIVRVSKRFPEPGTFVPPSEGGPMIFPQWLPNADDPGKILDFVELHATQSDRFYKQTPKK